MTFVFKHPKYYKELRSRNKLDQAISERVTETSNSKRSPGPGHKQQAASDSQVVNQVKLSSQSQAPGTKLQASSSKGQASSKPEPVQVQQASSAKRQASQPE